MKIFFSRPKTMHNNMKSIINLKLAFRRIKNIGIWITLAFTLGNPAFGNSVEEAIALLKVGSYSEAEEIFEIHATEQNHDALFWLGVIYNEGLGQAEDVTRAIQFFEKSAGLGNIDSMVNLGSLYLQDERVPPDHLMGYYWFMEAARGGDAQALSALASMMHMGTVFPPNKSDAIRFAMLAKSNGWSYEDSFYDYVVTKEVSPKVLKRLQRELEECRLPFDQNCEISAKMSLDTIYIRQSNLNYMKHKKGLFLDTIKKEPIEKIFNHYVGTQLSLPLLFSEKNVRFFPNKDKDDVCHVMGGDMDLVWYSNSSMPEGKYLEFGEKDYLEFSCSKINLPDLR